MRWKFFLQFLLLSVVLLPVYSESETDLETEVIEVPKLVPTEEYVLTGQDIMTLYQTLKDTNEIKNEYKNLTNEMIQTSKDAVTLARKYEKEKQKLVLQNNFLIGTTVCSVGIVVAGVITLVVMNIH